ncbi:MAG: flagellar basal body P-ring protein FlgI [Phycisphaerales bacterium]
MRAWILGLVVAMTVAVSTARATTVGDLTRLKGHGQFKLQGFGLVVGLNATGDSGKELVVARPLAAALTRSGNAPQNLQELSQSKSVALVTVSVTIPEAGARFDDRFDAIVSVVNSAKSLKGGMLYLAPLRGPTASHVEPFAIAEGPIEIEDTGTPTVGRIRGGAQMIKEVIPAAIEDSFEMIIDPAFVGYLAATEIASAINAAAQPQGPGVAKVVDDRTIRVQIPDYERENKAAFIAAVESADVNPSLLGLGARVIYNARRGAIIVTADVEISPVAITQKDLSITTVTPSPTPSAQRPLIEQGKWVGVGTRGRESENAKLSELLAAFKQLKIPAPEQINILEMLHKAGKLHAELIVD